jgi:heme A synthase
VLAAFQVALGFVNVWLLAPVWMQLTHLLAADLLWIALVVLTASALARRPAAVTSA